MTFVYIESLQLGLNTESSFRFEKELVEMTKLLGRQLPELRGGLVDGASRDLSWLVECTIRPPLTTPTAPTYTFRLIDHPAIPVRMSSGFDWGAMYGAWFIQYSIQR